MMAQQNGALPKHLTETQTKTYLQYKRKLAKHLPNARIAWVLPIKKNIIEVYVETEKLTYRTGLKAAKLATEVEDQTGVTIILR